MVVNKNYSVGEQAFEILEAESMEYGANGVKSSVVVDALRWEFGPTQEQEALDTVLNEYDTPQEAVDGFKFQRGQTKQLSVTLPSELDESLRSEARRIYGNKKVGKYMSKIVYDYYVVRNRKARLLLEDSEPENQKEYRDLLRDNYSLEIDIDDLPDGFTTAKTHRQAVPLIVANLRESETALIPDVMVDDVTEFIIEEYTEIESDKTVESYNDKVKDRLAEIVNLYGKSQHSDYYFADDEQARAVLTDEVSEWVEMLEVQISKHNDATVTHNKIRGHKYEKIMESVKGVRGDYAGWMSPEVLAELDATVQTLEEMYETREIDIFG